MALESAHDRHEEIIRARRLRFRRQAGSHAVGNHDLSG